MLTFTAQGWTSATVIAVYHNDALRLLKCARHHGVGRGNIGLGANESTSEVFICKLQVRERFAK